MSLRFAFLTLAVLLAVLTGSATSTLAAPPPAPEDEARIGQILEEWQRRSSQWTSLDVNFDRIVDQPARGDKELYKGRAVLIRGGAALVEFVKLGENGKDSGTRRLLWRGREFHDLQLESKLRTTWTIAEQDDDRLPAMLALPFCWQTSVETLRSRYQIALLTEDPETYSLLLIPISKRGKSEASKIYLQLDRQTSLPRRFFWLSPDDYGVHDFRVTKAQVNEPARPELLEVPQGEGWTVTRPEEQFWPWVLRLFKSDLLP